VLCDERNRAGRWPSAQTESLGEQLARRGRVGADGELTPTGSHPPRRGLNAAAPGRMVGWLGSTADYY
jgi:hypothetical protein